MNKEKLKKYLIENRENRRIYESTYSLVRQALFIIQLKYKTQTFSGSM